MIKFFGISEELSATLELDDHVPVQLTWGRINYPAFEVIWQLVTDRSVFQVGLNPRTKVIRSLKVILAQNKECDSKVRLPVEIKELEQEESRQIRVALQC